MQTPQELAELQQMCQELSILMVEDDVVLADSYNNMAKKFFKHVTTAYTPLEAIKLYRPGVFDIIYTDINMPGMSGIDMIRKIKEHDRKQKFVVISASDESANLLELLKLNISAFILKPFTLENFTGVTREQASIILHTRMMEQRTYALEDELNEVTKEKARQEKILIQQSKLAQTGEMISMIAHQWRQPLSSITTLIAGLKTRLELGAYDNVQDPVEAISRDLYETFDKIERSADFLSSTINDFRNFYRPDNGVSSFDAIDAIESVVQMLFAGEGNIKITRRYYDRETIAVTTYRGELQQVLMSILNNAKDAMAENSIEAPELTITATCDDDILSIAVCDNAGGIDKEFIDHIFLPYFSTKSEKNGTGIGLHMAKTIIERHMNGTITAANDPVQNGACFTIKIPVNQTKRSPNA